MAFFLFHDNRADIGNQILVGGSFAEQSAQVMIVLAEEAGAELAVGGQPDAGAMAAEGLGDRGDEANLAGCAVSKTVLAGGFATFVGDLFEASGRGFASGLRLPERRSRESNGGRRPKA